MTYKVSIRLKDKTTCVILDAERVELLGVGKGILSIFKGRKNQCFLLDQIDFYVIEDNYEHS